MNERVGAKTAAPMTEEPELAQAKRGEDAEADGMRGARSGILATFMDLFVSLGRIRDYVIQMDYRKTQELQNDYRAKPF